MLALRDAARAMATLNGGFLDYATLLARLADTGVLTQPEADRLEADLNARVSGLTTRFGAFGVEIPPELRSGTAVFTVAAVEGFRLFLDSRRRRALREALAGNQALLDALATLRALDASYASMPAAHASLARSLERRGVTLADLERFSDRARELRILYERLRREPES